MSTSNELDFYKHSLETTISQATNVDDLLPLLRSFPIEKMKKLIHQNIGTFDLESCRKAYYKSMPITETLSVDVNSHILSFLPFETNQVKAVSKGWNAMCLQNEYNYYRLLQQSLEENDSIQYNAEKNDIIVIDKKREKLSPIEMKLGFHGPCESIDDAMSGASAYDVLFIHGRTSEPNGVIVKKSISMIGIGQSAKIADPYGDGDSFFIIGDWCEDQGTEANVYVQNICIDCSKAEICSEGAIHLSKYCKLALHRCTLHLGNSGVAVRTEACLEVDSCTFDGASTAVAISPAANDVSIKKSIFKNCGVPNEFLYSSENACIQIDDNEWCDVQFGKDGLSHSVKLTCIGNVFENNLCFPIAERAVPVDRDDDPGEMENAKYVPTSLYTLKENVLKGSNGTSVRPKQAMDANKMYYNTAEFKLT